MIFILALVAWLIIIYLDRKKKVDGPTITYDFINDCELIADNIFHKCPADMEGYICHGSVCSMTHMYKVNENIFALWQQYRFGAGMLEKDGEYFLCTNWSGSNLQATGVINGVYRRTLDDGRV